MINVRKTFLKKTTSNGRLQYWDIKDNNVCGNRFDLTTGHIVLIVYNSIESWKNRKIFLKPYYDIYTYIQIQ